MVVTRDGGTGGVAGVASLDITAGLMQEGLYMNWSWDLEGLFWNRRNRGAQRLDIRNGSDGMSEQRVCVGMEYTSRLRTIGA